jgi:predicted metal-binding membrane protein
MTGAGTGMGPTTSFLPFPTVESSMSGMSMVSPWTAGRFVMTFAMWWVMMVAMMLPSAAPTILLYARAASGNAAVRPATEMFLAGYLVVWGLFSLLATVLQAMLDWMHLLAQMEMALASRTLSGVLLISAGIYQLSPFKQACLTHCRGPADFISRHFKPGKAGALRMGMVHGVYCVGCCWLLMILLFAGGIMNLAWIGFLTLLVAVEKLLPFGSYIGRIAGLGCAIAGIAIVAR